MMRKLFVTVAVMVFSFAFIATIYAAQNQPLELEADTIEYDSASGMANAQGNVRITRGTAVLTGPSAEYNTKSQEAHMTGGVKMVQDNATLTAAELRTAGNNRVTASGDVVLTKGDDQLTGPEVDYDADRQYAVVNSDARLSSPDGIMTADKLEAFLADNRAVGSGHVHIVSDAHKLDAVSDQAVYYGNQKGQGKVVLSGNATAIQDGNKLTGEHLTVYLGDKSAVDATGRTKLIIIPQN